RRMRISHHLINKATWLNNQGKDLVQALEDDKEVDMIGNLLKYKRGGKSMPVEEIKDPGTRVATRLLQSCGKILVLSLEADELHFSLKPWCCRWKSDESHFSLAAVAGELDEGIWRWQRCSDSGLKLVSGGGSNKAHRLIGGRERSLQYAQRSPLKVFEVEDHPEETEKSESDEEGRREKSGHEGDEEVEQPHPSIGKRPIQKLKVETDEDEDPKLYPNLTERSMR
ncbi:hypothetical protein KI387_028581, partial [Taxus chinensis]